MYILIIFFNLNCMNFSSILQQWIATMDCNNGLQLWHRFLLTELCPSIRRIVAIHRDLNSSNWRGHFCKRKRCLQSNDAARHGEQLICAPPRPQFEELRSRRAANLCPAATAAKLASKKYIMELPWWFFLWEHYYLGLHIEGCSVLSSMDWVRSTAFLWHTWQKQFLAKVSWHASASQNSAVKWQLAPLLHLNP